MKYDNAATILLEAVKCQRVNASVHNARENAKEIFKFFFQHRAHIIFSRCFFFISTRFPRQLAHSSILWGQTFSISVYKSENSDTNSHLILSIINEPGGVEKNNKTWKLRWRERNCNFDHFCTLSRSCIVQFRATFYNRCTFNCAPYND